MSNSQVAILMATYNGEKFIGHQLDSLLAQSYPHWSLWASDDNSVDKTNIIVSSFMQNNQINGNVFRGPGRGVCDNFKSLILNKKISATYYAFSDQDDIWFTNKLERAVGWLDTVSPHLPAFFCSRTELINQMGDSIGYSPDYIKPPSFANALLQNIASGNTMVFNQKARELLQLASNSQMVIHDWALYLVVMACGGHVFYDRQPTLYYRQHADNLIGNGMGMASRFRNFRLAYQGRRAVWNDINISMLRSIIAFMTLENRRCMDDFSNVRNKFLIERLYLLWRSGVYHQQTVGMLTTVAHTILNRM